MRGTRAIPRQVDALITSSGKGEGRSASVSRAQRANRKGAAGSLAASGKGGAHPEGNLNNGILFLYINKCSEKSQI